MNLQDLRYFVAVAANLHFGKAAAECHVSQPTLSGQLRKLEETLGVVLFERTNKRVALTPVGSQLLPHARKALEEALVIQDMAAASHDPLSGKLRVGIIPTLAPYLVPLWLGPMKQAYPSLHIELWEDLTDALLQMLRDHRLDAVLVASEDEDKELRTIPLFREPFLAALPTGHALSHVEVVREEDLQPDILVLAEGHCLARQSLEACGRLEENKHNAHLGQLQATSLDTLLNLVGAGYGTTLVPALATGSVCQRNLELRPLAGGASRTVQLVTRATFPRPQAVDAVATVVKRVVEGKVLAA